MQTKNIKIVEFKNYLNQLINKTENETLIKYISAIKDMPNEQLGLFIKKIKLQTSQDDLINKIKDRIAERIWIPEKVEHVYINLHSELRDSNYLDTKAGVKIVISFEDCRKKFGRCFQIGLSNKLQIRKPDLSLPADLNSQLFIKQLIDIKDINENDKVKIMEYTTAMLLMYNNLETWKQEGEISKTEADQFIADAESIHERKFHSKYRKYKTINLSERKLIKEDTIIKCTALELLDEVRSEKLTLGETTLSFDMSNGQFYTLTDMRQIGWHFLWKTRYTI